MMPYYYDATNFQQVSLQSHPEFGKNFPINTPAPKAGIYRCSKCGHEIAIAEGHQLPPDSTHNHPAHDHSNLSIFEALRESQKPYYWMLKAQAIHIHDKK